jgi:hypothetical protein
MRLVPNSIPAADADVVIVYRDPSVAISPDPAGLSFRHDAPVLPPQGVGVFDICLIDRFAVPFICPAIRMQASCFLSIWPARPASIQNSENTSAAPIESNAEFLYTIHHCMVAYGDHFLAMLKSNQHAS